MTNETQQNLKIPAIGLMVVGILNILFGLYFILTLVIVLYGGIDYKGFSSEQEKLLFNVGLYGVITVGIISLLVAPLVIYGALKMMRGENPGSAKRAAVLAMIPLTSAAFILGIPFGLWALSNLKKIGRQENFPVEDTNQFPENV